MLTLQNISFSYTPEPFIKNLDLHINRGEYIGIIGPNGSGKSTLLRLMAGLLKPRQGQTLLENKQLFKLMRKEIAQQISYVPQTILPLPGFFVKGVVAMGRYPYSKGLLTTEPRADTLIAQALSETGLAGFGDRQFNTLSGGEQQRVIIASALAQQTDLMLLDEPTSALDIRHQQGIYKLLKELSHKQNKTIVVVTHDINLAAQFCDRLVLMDQGQIVADGPPGNVLQFDRIEQVYGVKVFIDINPFTKSIYILPFDAGTD